jgi:hypothetical protein
MRKAEPGAIEVVCSAKAVQKDASTGRARSRRQEQDLVEAATMFSRRDKCRRSRIELDEDGIRLRRERHHRDREHVGIDRGSPAGGRG